MRCLEREKLFAFTQGMLEGREAERARAHVAECENCRRVVEAYRRLDAVLDEWKPVEPSPEFDARVQRAVEAAPAQPSGFFERWGWPRWLAPALALAAVAFAVSLLWVRSQRSPQTMPQMVKQAAPQVTPAPAPPQEVAQGPTEKIQTAKKSRPAVKASKDEGTGVEESADDYDMLANFEVLSELAPVEKKVAN